MRSRWAVSSWRFHAACDLGRSTVSIRSRVSEEMTPSSTTPAEWTTPRSGRSAGMSARTAARLSRSATSQAATVASAPSAASPSTSSWAPGACGPFRPSSSRWRTPCSAARWRATAAPRTPVPPVMSTVPCGSHTGAGSSPVRSPGAAGAVRASRGAHNVPSRSTSSGSPAARAVRTAGTRAAAVTSAASAGRSSCTMRSGCSDWAERSRPRAAACGRSGPCPPTVSRVAAFRVTSTRRAGANRSSSSQACTVSSAQPVASLAASATSTPSPERSGQATTTASGAAVPASRAAPSAARSAYGVTSASTAPVSAAAVSPTAAQTGRGAPSAAATADTSAQPARYSQSPWPRAARSWSPVTGRRASEPTEASGSPAPSVMVTVTPPVPVWARRTRTVLAPVAYRRTPSQEKGSPRGGSPPPVASSRDTPCSAASRTAGCRQKSPASPASPPSGSRTSANTSVPRRQAALSPWKVGP